MEVTRREKMNEMRSASVGAPNRPFGQGTGRPYIPRPFLLKKTLIAARTLYEAF